MQKSTLTSLTSTFESHRHEHEWVEFWYARELQGLLGYDRWESFERLIERAIVACRNSKQKPIDHFRGVAKMVSVGSSAEREIQDYHLTRYACYLIAQNGDSRKQEIAFAMSYFAFSTRRLELIEERFEEIERVQARVSLTDTEKVFSWLLYERGIDGAGFARIRSSGDRAFFWGHTTEDMKHRLGMWTSKKPLADHLPTVTLKAKDFATALTNHNITEKWLHTESHITLDHTKNNQNIRKLLLDEGIIPEQLAPAEDVEKVKRRLWSQEKKILKDMRK